MDGHIWGELPHKAQNPDVRHDDGIDARVPGVADDRRQALKLRIVGVGIEGEIDADSAGCLL